MKISFYGDFENPYFEGRMRVFESLRKGLSDKGFDIVYNSPDADIIHGFSSGISLSGNLSRIKKRKKIPCIYSLISACEAPFFEYVNTLINEGKYSEMKLKDTLLYSSVLIPLRLKAKKLKDLDKVIVPTDIMKKRLFSNTKTIKIGIDTNKFKPSIKKRNKVLKAGYLGYASYFRGIEDVLKASKLVKDYDYNFYCQNLNKKAIGTIKGINPDVNIFGEVKDIKQVYNNLDITIFPFLMRASAILTPLVILESMAMGNAVIGSDVDTIKEIIGDAGLIVPTHSPKKIAAALEMLKDDNLRLKLGRKARERIEKEYSDKKMVEEYIKVYEQLS